MHTGSCMHTGVRCIYDYIVGQLKSGSLQFSCEDPDEPRNFPRNMFIWRSNILGSSGKGHEYMLKYLLGTQNGLLGEDLAETGGTKPEEVVWHDKAPAGKLDLVVKTLLLVQLQGLGKFHQ